MTNDEPQTGRKNELEELLRAYLQADRENADWYWLDEIKTRIKRDRYHQIVNGVPEAPETPEQIQQRQQDIVDLVMRQMALRHGSSTRRDFEAARLTIEAYKGLIQ